MSFNYGEFAIIKTQAGLNSYKINVKEWVSKTNSKGIVAKTGRYGGTYAHKDIAFEFSMWISSKFKLLLIKQSERLIKLNKIVNSQMKILTETNKKMLKD